MLWTGWLSVIVGVLACWVTKKAYALSEDFDEETKTHVDKQLYMLIVVQLAMPLFVWGTACLGR